MEKEFITKDDLANMTEGQSIDVEKLKLLLGSGRGKPTSPYEIKLRAYLKEQEQDGQAKYLGKLVKNDIANFNNALRKIFGESEKTAFISTRKTQEKQDDEPLFLAFLMPKDE